jgi:hypothetical protein
MIARRCARDVASFMIIAARTAKLIRTIIEITGYPAPKEIAPPTPALRSIEARPLLSAAIGTRPSRKATGANGLDALGLIGPLLAE